MVGSIRASFVAWPAEPRASGLQQVMQAAAPAPAPHVFTRDPDPWPQVVKQAAVQGAAGLAGGALLGAAAACFGVAGAAVGTALCGLWGALVLGPKGESVLGPTGSRIAGAAAGLTMGALMTVGQGGSILAGALTAGAQGAMLGVTLAVGEGRARHSLAEYVDLYSAMHTQKGTHYTHYIGEPLVATSVPLAVRHPLIAGGMFALGWAFQFAGHHLFEKNNPSFFEDPVFLLIGPVWVARQANRALGVSDPGQP